MSALLDKAIVWDNHACMPLSPEDDAFLPQLARHKAGGATLVSLNVTYDAYAPETGFLMLASFRKWIREHADEYMVADTVEDIEAAKRDGKLAIVFDIEGGRAVEAHPGLVEVYYRLGVRWMLIAYNKNNKLGGGCQDEDCGLTDYGREVIDEMERVGMVLCCSHTGYRTAREAFAYAKKPAIFSHSNPRALHDHPRNVPDDLIVACAKTGGVVNSNGIGIFLGANDNSTEALMRHIDHVVRLVGTEHVGLGLDYCFDQEGLNAHIKERPDLFPPDKGYAAGIRMVEPERIPEIAEALAKRYGEEGALGILGGNNLRVAREVWK